MKKDFLRKDWENYLPRPVCDGFPEYNEFYFKAWELARAHVRLIDGMPQNPYMDEAFCDTQVWIWDTCFMSLFCKFAQEVFPGKETLRNFYEVLYNGKDLPSIIPTQDEPWWTGAIPGMIFPIQIHLADNPPLFAFAEYENALFHGDRAYLEKLLKERQVLQKHYDWIEGLQENVRLRGVAHSTMLKKTKDGYKWEGCRSGMDNTPRGRKEVPAKEERPNNPDLLWIDAICQQALSAKVIANLFKLLGDEAQEKKWLVKHEEKKKIVNDLYWDKEDKFYYDIDCNDLQYNKVRTIASYWALTAEIAEPEQASQMVEYLKDDKFFGGAVPFASLARNDANFVDQGQYWRGSVWLPTAYATLKGLTKYGYHKEAHILANKLLSHMWKTYLEYEPHTIWECYSPTEYKPATQTDNKTIVRPDFCGWSALGPISIYIEYVLGFHTVNAFEKVVAWEKPNDVNGEIGIKNLRFGEIVTDIIANDDICKVKSSGAYTLKIDNVAYSIVEGENLIDLSVKNS